jgi:hypothetical protein
MLPARGHDRAGGAGRARSFCFVNLLDNDLAKMQLVHSLAADQTTSAQCMAGNSKTVS